MYRIKSRKTQEYKYLPHKFPCRCHLAEKKDCFRRLSSKDNISTVCAFLCIFAWKLIHTQWEYVKFLTNCMKFVSLINITRFIRIYHQQIYSRITIFGEGVQWLISLQPVTAHTELRRLKKSTKCQNNISNNSPRFVMLSFIFP